MGGTERNPFTMREEIITMLKMPASTDGDIQPVEKQMIQRLFNFTETRVEDSMRPLIAVTAIDREATCGEARRLAIETSHARLPVSVSSAAQGVRNVQVAEKSPSRVWSSRSIKTRYRPVRQKTCRVELDAT